MPRKPYDYHYIYKTTNLVNEKFYIGMHSTSNLEDGYIGSGKRLWLSIKKYGRENFKMEILEFLPDRNSLKTREEQVVNESLLQDPLCMNLRLGGGGMQSGSSVSDETRKKISINSKSGTEEVRKKISIGNLGKAKPCSEESRKKMSETRTGKSQSEEQVSKRIDSIKKTWIIRKEKGLDIKRSPCSEETKEKIRISNINNGRIMTGENNPRAKTYKFINPDGVEFIVKGTKRKFCIENNINIKKAFHLSEYNGWKIFEI